MTATVLPSYIELKKNSSLQLVTYCCLLIHCLSVICPITARSSKGGLDGSHIIELKPPVLSVPCI